MKKTITIKILSLLAIIFFFLPFFSVSCMSQSISINGITMMTGVEVIKGTPSQGGNFLMIFLLLIPLLIFILSFILRKWEDIITIVGSIIALGMVFISQAFVAISADKYYATVKLEIGYYLTILVYLALIIVSVIGLILKINHKNKNKGVLENEINREIESS